MPLYYPPEAGGGELPPLGYRDIYVDPPSSPDPWNDEFDSGSPVLADRGLRLTRMFATGELTTRVGEVDIYAPALALTEYRSSIRGSCLSLQVPGANSMVWLLNKATTPTSAAYATRIIPRRDGLFDQYLGLAIGSTINQGQGTVDRSIYVYAELDTTSHSITRYQNGFANILSATTTDDGPTVFWADCQIDASWNLRYNAETNIHGRTVVVTASQLGPFIDFGPGSLYAGAMVAMPSTYMNWVEIDYIRRYPVHSYFPA